MEESHRSIEDFMDFMTTSESEKKRTETSKHSKLQEITELLDDSNLLNVFEAKMLREKLEEREYKLFQHYLGFPDNKCDWKLWKMTLDYLENYLDRLESKIWVKRDANLELWQLQNAIDTSNIQRNEARYRELYETMWQNEYNWLFSWLDRLQQWQLWDCYLVSWIIELAGTQHFDTLIRTSFQRMRRSNWDLWYQIKIPLWEPSWRKILIKDSELSVAKIRWNDWYKFLELAYAKHVLRKNDKEGNKYRPITSSELSKIEGWNTREVLETFLWHHNISFNTFWKKYGTLSLKQRHNIIDPDKKELIWFLKNYNPNIWNKFVSLGSLCWGSGKEQYKVWWKTMYYNHAYALTWVTKDRKWDIEYIIVLNPWNTGWDWNGHQYFTVSEFFEAFGYVSCWTIKTRTFLDNKWMPGPFDFLSVF